MSGDILIQVYGILNMVWRSAQRDARITLTSLLTATHRNHRDEDALKYVVALAILKAVGMIDYYEINGENIHHGPCHYYIITQLAHSAGDLGLYLSDDE